MTSVMVDGPFAVVLTASGIDVIGGEVRVLKTLRSSDEDGFCPE
jgi:hypothetical protein